MLAHELKRFRLVYLAIVLAPAAGFAQLKINEVYYRPSAYPNANQFVELYNVGTNTVYLDGLILTEEASDGVEGVFRFPGSGTDHPVPPGGYVVIAADADNSDGLPPDLSTLADWECYAGAADFDNPSVPNLTLVAGLTDLSMYPGGDNVILADGTDLTVPIDPATYIDSVNFASGGGELAMLTSEYDDLNPYVTSAIDESLMRCPDGHDTDYASGVDFLSGTPTPGAANPSGCPPRIIVRNFVTTEGDSGTTTARVPVVRSLAGGPVVTVMCQSSGGTAVPGVDYVSFTNTLTFPTGVGTQFLDVVIIGDTQVEPEETIVLRIFNATGADIITSQAVVRVLDNDLPMVSVGDLSIAEGDTGTNTANFFVQLSSAYTTTVSVMCFTSNGTAEAGSDYIGVAPTTLVFNVGVTSLPFHVSVLGDTNVEPDEVFYVHLQNPVNAALGHAPATCTIVNDDNVTVSPDMWISDAQVTEGNTGFTSAVFTVTLSVSSPFDVSVRYATADGSASAPADYTAISSTLLSFSPGVTSRTISVSVAGDVITEPDQTFFVNLSSPSNATLVDAQGLGTIFDDDPLAVTCPNTITALVSGADTGTNVAYSATVSTNECGAGVTYVPPSGSFFPLGTNLVTATASDTCGHSVTCSFEVIVLSTGTGSVGLAKSVYAGHDGGASAPGLETLIVTNGADVTYCFVVTNSGNVALTNVVVNDATLPGFSPPALGTLAPGQVVTSVFETTASASRTNTATVTGWPIGLSTVSNSDSAIVIVTSPGLGFSKTVYAGHNGGADAPGSESIVVSNNADITYCFVATNSGNGALTNVVVNDATLPGFSPLVLGTLAPGQVVTSVFETTAGASSRTNTATATGSPIGLSNVSTSDTAVVIVLHPKLGLNKTVYAGHDSGAAAPGTETIVVSNNSDVTYCFVVTNSGDIALTNVVVDDATLSGFSPLLLGTLAPGQVVTSIFETIATASRTNTATASGSPPSLPNVSTSDTAVVVVLHPKLGFNKTVYVGHNGGASAPGSESVSVTNNADITYCFVATNSGDIALTNVVVNDATLPGFSPLLLGALAPGQVVTSIFETTATASRTNTATATGSPPGLSNVSTSDTAVAVVLHPGLALSKTVYAGHDGGASAPGLDVIAVTNATPITFCLVVTNSGDVALTNVAATDVSLPGFGLQLLGTLVPGQVVTTIFETALGTSLTNHATVTGQAAAGPVVSASDTSVVFVVHPGIGLSKSVYAGHDGGASAPGLDSITVSNNADVTFCFVATNSGDTTLTNVVVNDATLPGFSPLLLGTLTPGQVVTSIFETIATASRTNTATASGSPPSLSNVSTSDTAVVVVLHPKLGFSKTVYVGHDGGASAPGSESVSVSNNADITYCFVATNSGDATLTNVVVNDATLPGFSPLVLGTLAPGQVVTSIFETTATASRTNTATATGSPPGFSNLSTSDTAVVIVPHPSLALGKTVYVGHDGGASAPGSESVTVTNNADITYCFVATNSGDTALTNVVINDATLPGFSPLALGTLAPGQVVTSVFETAAGASSRTNTATATGSPPGLSNVSTSDTAVVIVLHPKLGLNKTVYAGHDGGASAPGFETVAVSNGADVTYCFVATNSGDATLTNVVVNDATLPGFSPLVLGTLTPGQVVTSIFETTAAASLTNTATIAGAPPVLSAVSTSDTAAVIVVSPRIALSKTVYVGHNGGASAPGVHMITVSNNASVTYCFVVTNTGDYGLTNVVVTDATLPGFSPLALGTLSPGQSVTSIFETTASASRTNSATAAGSPGGLPQVSGGDTAVVVVIHPKVGLNKTVYAGHNGGASAPGQESITVTGNTPVTYCFVVTNSGDIALTNVIVSDATIPGFSPIAVGTLAPGQVVTSIFETAAGASLTNRAAVTGAPPVLPPVYTSDTAAVVVVHPGIALSKAVYAGHNGGASAPGIDYLFTTSGADVTYCFLVTNSGNVAVSNVTVSDATLPGFTNLLLGAMNPGQVRTGIFETTASASFTNRATVMASVPSLPSISAADTSVVVVLHPLLDFSKAVYLGHDGGTTFPGTEYIEGTNGTAITYVFFAINSGDTTLTNVTVTDPGLIMPPINFGTLVPGQSATGFYEAVLSADRINQGFITGQAAGGLTAANQDTAEVKLIAPPNDCTYSYEVIDLGTFGGTNSQGLGISDLGQVVGGADAPDGIQRAFLWENGEKVDLGTLPGGLYASAWDINAQGEISGTSDATGFVFGTPIEDHAFRYKDGAMTDLGTLGGKTSKGRGMNEAGDVVGWSFRVFQNFNVNPYLHTYNTNINMELFCGVDDPGEAFDVNDATQAVGFAYACGPYFGFRPFIWHDYDGNLRNSPYEMTDLGTFGGDNGVAHAINNAGQIVGGADLVTSPTTIRHAFLITPINTVTGQQWAILYGSKGTNSLMTDLGVLPGHTFADAWDINDSGTIVGTSYSNSTSRAFIYRSGVMTRLDALIDPASGWTLTEARAINNLDQITGMGIISNRTHAFLLNPCISDDGSLRITRLIPEDLNPQNVIIVWNNLGIGNTYRLESALSLTNLIWIPLPPTSQWPTLSTYWLMTLDSNTLLDAIRVRANP